MSVKPVGYTGGDSEALPQSTAAETRQEGGAGGDTHERRGGVYA